MLLVNIQVLLTLHLQVVQLIQVILILLEVASRSVLETQQVNHILEVLCKFQVVLVRQAVVQSNCQQRHRWKQMVCRLNLEMLKLTTQVK